MPTPVAHSLAGTSISILFEGRRPVEWKPLVASITAACFADIDFGIGYVIGRNVHHYFTHSLGFGLLFTAAVYVLARALRRAGPGHDALVLGTAYLSHIVLDLLSKDSAAPYGLELFWPFSKEFFISPVLVFEDIWRGTLAKLFGLHNWLAVGREILVVGPATVALWWWKRRQEYS